MKAALRHPKGDQKMNMHPIAIKRAAMLAIGSAPNATQAQAVDPIIAAIAAHRIAYHEHYAAVTRQSLLEDILPDEVTESFITAFDRKIVKSDDARWIASVKKVDKASDEMDAAAQVMVRLKPTTLAGVAALLRYAAEHVADGNCWPDYAVDESDGSERDFTQQLHLTVAEAVEAIDREANSLTQDSRH
jgi:hypothetical protein